MIQANELRLGNWVNLRKGGKPEYAYQISSGHAIEEIDDYGEDTFPIPLTAEILEKAGFSTWHSTVNMCDNGYYPKQFWGIMEGVDSMGQRIITYGFIIGVFRYKDHFFYQSRGSYYKGIRITCVHQLQNLYHALTGEELIINL